MINTKLFLRRALLTEVVKSSEGKSHWGSEAAGIIGITDDNKILLLQRSNLVDEPGTWVYPGGKVAAIADSAFSPQHCLALQ